MLIDGEKPRQLPVFKTIFLVFLLYSIALCCIGATASTEAIAHMFSEEGFFERASGVLWMIAAFVALIYIKHDKFRAILFSTSFFLLCARENDLHRAFTQDSILKLNYYRHSIGHEKYISAFVVFLILVTLGVFIYQITRYLVRENGTKQACGQIMLLALASTIATKIDDRLPSVLRKDYNIILMPRISEVMKALEEGIEMALPLLFIISMLVLPNIFTSRKK